MKIPKGYQLTVVSWENDGDNYNTKVVNSEDKDLIQLYVSLCSLLSVNHHEGGIGNMYDPDDKKLDLLAERVRPVIVKHEQSIRKLWNNDSHDLLQDDCNIRNVFTELLGDICGYGEFYTRVVESYVVSYSPVEIEIEDVTHKFEE